jgi:hypothetical protein
MLFKSYSFLLRQIVGWPYLFFWFTFHLKFCPMDSPSYGRTLRFLDATSIKSQTKMFQAASLLGKRLYLCKVSGVKYIIFLTKLPLPSSIALPSFLCPRAWHAAAHSFLVLDSILLSPTLQVCSLGQLVSVTWLSHYPAEASHALPPAA